MSLAGKTLKLCNCNQTMSLDAKALGEALDAGAALTIHTQLCRKEAGAYQSAYNGGQYDAFIARFDATGKVVEGFGKSGRVYIDPNGSKKNTLHNAGFEAVKWDGRYQLLPVAESWEAFKATVGCSRGCVTRAARSRNTIRSRPGERASG